MLKPPPKNNTSPNALKAFNAGYTLIELLVVLGIFSLLLGVLLFNQQKLDSNILVTNLAYEFALSIRQAQTYGISARTNNPGQQNFSGGYGLYYDSSSPNQLVLFNDINGNGQYDAAVPGELSSVFTIQNQRGNTITAVFVNNVDASGNPQSFAVGAPFKVNTLNILFKRPNPEPILSYTGGMGNAATGLVQIVLNTPTGDDCRSVFVYQTGDVRVDSTQSLCRP